MLMIARLLQGVAAGIQMPQVLGLIQQLFQGKERGRAFGLFGATIGIATAFGPTIGGLLILIGGATDGWRLTFWMNVPLGTHRDRSRGLGAAEDPHALSQAAVVRRVRGGAVRPRGGLAHVALPVHDRLARRRSEALVAPRRLRAVRRRFRRVGAALRAPGQAAAHPVRPVPRFVLPQRHAADRGLLHRAARTVPPHDALPADRRRARAGVRRHGHDRVRPEQRALLMDRRQPRRDLRAPGRRLGPRRGARLRDRTRRRSCVRATGVGGLGDGRGHGCRRSGRRPRDVAEPDADAGRHPGQAGRRGRIDRSARAADRHVGRHGGRPVAVLRDHLPRVGKRPRPRGVPRRIRVRDDGRRRLHRRRLPHLDRGSQLPPTHEEAAGADADPVVGAAASVASITGFGGCHRIRMLRPQAPESGLSIRIPYRRRHRASR